MKDEIEVAEKMDSTPPLFTINGCGFKLYGDTLYLTLIFIPIIPLARYMLEPVKDQHGKTLYRFYGKKKLKRWQRIWVGLIVILILVFIVRIFFNI